MFKSKLLKEICKGYGQVTKSWISPKMAVCSGTIKYFSINVKMLTSYTVTCKENVTCNV